MASAEQYVPCARDVAMLSFVIPARNEEAMISGTIESIHKSTQQRFPYEIIVTDHGSTDRTAAIARSRGARVITQPGGTIGALRNTGARHARGDLIVFLDADVLLTAEWATRIPESVEMLTAQPRLITGSLCDIPANASWIERTWFAPQGGRRSSHLGSGHMIISRRFFQSLGGFDESLITGEDWDLSHRARTQNASLVADAHLRVEHLGFPKTIGAFIKREVWHGASDFRSFAQIARSKVALLTLAIALLHGAGVIGLIAGRPIAILMATAGITSISLLSSAWKYREAGLHIVALNSALFYIYYFARGLSAMRLWCAAKPFR